MKNMREYNKKVNAKMFLSLLAIVFALGAGSNAAMAGVPEQSAAVSENDPDTENHKETGVSLKEKKLPRRLKPDKRSEQKEKIRLRLITASLRSGFPRMKNMFMILSRGIT